MTPTDRSISRARAATALLVAAGVGLGLHVLRGHGVPTPPLDDLGALHAWVDEHGPFVAAMSALRLAAIALAAHVVLVAIASLLVSSTAAPRSLDRAVRRMTPRVLRCALGFGAATVVAMPTPVRAADAPVLVFVADGTAQPADPPVLEWIDGAVPDAAPPAAEEAPASGTRTWEVRPGDHFWSIAEAVVREQDGDASDAEITRYWRTLVEANRDRLVVPGNPDLVLPGQELALPTR